MYGFNFPAAARKRHGVLSLPQCIAKLLKRHGLISNRTYPHVQYWFHGAPDAEELSVTEEAADTPIHQIKRSNTRSNYSNVTGQPFLPNYSSSGLALGNGFLSAIVWTRQSGTSLAGFYLSLRLAFPYFSLITWHNRGLVSIPPCKQILSKPWRHYAFK